MRETLREPVGDAENGGLFSLVALAGRPAGEIVMERPVHFATVVTAVGQLLAMRARLKLGLLRKTDERHRWGRASRAATHIGFSDLTK